MVMRTFTINQILQLYNGNPCGGQNKIVLDPDPNITNESLKSAIITRATSILGTSLDLYYTGKYRSQYLNCIAVSPALQDVSYIYKYMEFFQSKRGINAGLFTIDYDVQDNLMEFASSYSTAKVQEFPKTITRGNYSFVANNSEEEVDLKNFLGIDPSGFDMDTYLTGKTKIQIDGWRDYWVMRWNQLGRTDLVSFVNTKHDAMISPVVKLWSEMTSEEKLSKMIELYSAMTPTERDTPIQILAYQLKISELEAGAFFTANETQIKEAIYGTGVPLTWQDLLDFVIVGELVNIPIKIGTRYMINEGGHVVLREVTSTGSKEIFWNGESQLAKGLAKASKDPTLWKSIVASLKANPLMSVFVATEIPNLIVMGYFAYHQVLAETGGLASSLSFTMNDIEKAMSNSQYQFDQAIKRGDMTTARTLYDSYVLSLTTYENIIIQNTNLLTTAKVLDQVNALLEMYITMKDVMLKQLPTSGSELSTSLRELMDVQVIKVTDGDTVNVTTLDFPAKTFTVRILGSNAPDKDLTTVWVKSLIDGVETRYELTAKDYKNANAYAVTTLMRAYVTLQIDPNNTMDKYDRVLASIKYNTGSGNYALDSVRKGLSVAYLQGENKFVDIGSFKTAQSLAMKEKLGMWGTVQKGLQGILKLSSSPTNAKIYLDGVYTKHLTPETLNLDAGDHTILLTRTGYADTTQNYTITAMTTQEDKIDMVKLETTAGIISSDQGILRLTSSPSNAKIYLDGVYTKHLTPETMKLTAGHHIITVTKTKYIDATGTYDIIAGERIEDNLTLEKITI